MNIDLIAYYIKTLRDPSIPANRVIRKVAVITLMIICALIYYRHGVLGLGLWEPFIVTIVQVFLVAIVLGIFGGIGAGALYEGFLKRVDAHNSGPSIVVFFVECLFASTSPLFAILMMYVSSGGYDHF